jgi:hypothetical protein
MAGKSLDDPPAKAAPSSWLPSSKHTKSYWTLPFIVDLSIKQNVIFNSYVSLPEDIRDYDKGR